MAADDSHDDKTQSFIALTSGTDALHYKILEKIGSGGMGEVYLAEDTKLNRKVALKFLPPHLCQDEDCRKRFTREAQAGAKLNHPNIVTIHDVGEFNNRPFLVMEYVKGRSLKEHIEQGDIIYERIIAGAIQICDGLQTAHSAGIIHRDIKPSNIILDVNRRPRILDFGLAAVSGTEQLTKTGSTMGTVGYMSPEQISGREVDHRSDLFSLGVVLYELITSRTPFRRNNDAGTMQAILNESPEPLARYKSDVTAELQRMVDKTLAKDPSERYQSAADLSADLLTLSHPANSIGTKAAGEVAAGKPSIAVLPFANMSADPENEYFSDGLTEELLNVLARNPELKVTGRTSSFAFKGKQEDLRGIGQKLGVGTLLEGSVRKVGNRVRITAQLVSTVDGFHLWSETYDRVLDDIFEVQDEIAKSVSKAMNIRLVGVTKDIQKVNPESYALVLRAHQSALQMTKESLTVAEELYQRAIAIDPNNARAWAGLSYVLAYKCAYGHTDHQAVYPQAKKAAEKAIELDDLLPEAHQAMSFVFAALEMRFIEAMGEIRRAYALAPNDSDIVSHMSRALSAYGQFEESTHLAKHAVELDPLNPSAHVILAETFSNVDRLQEAEQSYLNVLRLSPEMTAVRSRYSSILLRQGRLLEALEMAGKEKLTGYRSYALAIVYYALGRQADSEHALLSLIGEGEIWGFQIAVVYALRGDTDKAFEWLERSYELRDSGIPMTKVSPSLKSLHSDPRWPVFLKKIGLDDKSSEVSHE